MIGARRLRCVFPFYFSGSLIIHVCQRQPIRGIIAWAMARRTPIFDKIMSGQRVTRTSDVGARAVGHLHHIDLVIEYDDRPNRHYL